MSKRNIRLWAFYDFANSLAFVNVSFYFGLWFIAEHHASDIWMSVSLGITTILMLVTLPIVGNWSDRIRRRKPFLLGCTVIAILSLLLLGFFMQTIRSDALTIGQTVTIFLLYSVFNYFYLSSFAFYDAFLRHLASNDRTLEKISAFGMALGQIGNTAGLLLAFPIAQGQISILGMQPKPAVLMVAAFLFLFCSLPVFLLLDESASSTGDSDDMKLGKSLRETIHDLKRIRELPGVLRYLVTYCLFADALLTLQLFASFYLDIVGKLDDTEKNITFLMALIFGVIGSLISPFLVRLAKSIRRAIMLCIGVWTVVLAAIALSTGPFFFMIFIILNGFAFGALFSLSRAYYASLVPPEKQAEMFGIYALFERTASVIGPLLWSITAFAFASFGDDRYRFSVLSLALIVGMSFFVFRMGPKNERMESGESL